MPPLLLCIEALFQLLYALASSPIKARTCRAATSAVAVIHDIIFTIPWKKPKGIPVQTKAGRNNVEELLTGEM